MLVLLLVTTHSASSHHSQAYAYDAVFAIAHALHELIEVQQVSDQASQRATATLKGALLVHRHPNGRCTQRALPSALCTQRAALPLAGERD